MYSRLQAKNRDLAKVITAKKVSASDLTYIPDLDKECLRIFKETYKEIALNGDLTGKTKQKQEQRIKELETALSTLAKDLQGYKTSTEILSKKTEKLEESLNEIKSHVAHNIEFDKRYSKAEKEALMKKYNIEPFSEEEKELLHVYDSISREYRDKDGTLTPEAVKKIEKKFRDYLKEREKKQKNNKKYCPICDAELSDEDIVCPSCGALIKEPAYDAISDAEDR